MESDPATGCLSSRSFAGGGRVIRAKLMLILSQSSVTCLKSFLSEMDLNKRVINNSYFLLGAEYIHS